jgi:L-alanine-DL-glutamate epimerase-like enolase superfamily enzyme
MKITSVEIFDIRSPKLSTTRIAWNPVIIRINTDEGISGLGEVGLAYGTGSAAGFGMVKNLAEHWLIGADPIKSEKIWERMFRSTFWALGGGPVVYGGMSAIDTALWDIKGKKLGVPIYQLLGGKTNDKLRSYASQIQAGWSTSTRLCITHKDYADAAQKAVAEGYTAVKVDPVACDAEGKMIPSLRGVLPAELTTLFYNRVKAIREAVGPNIDILLEIHGAFNTTTAIQMGRIWEDLSCFFYEEPVDSINAESMSKVAQSVRIPIAAGERIYTRWGYRQYFEKRILDIIQPDLGLVGGITEGKKICDAAHIHDITVQCHVCGTAVATAASLHMEAAIPNFIIHEYHVFALKEENREVVKQELQPKNGYFNIPDAPGLGIDLDDKVMTQYLSVKV